MRLLSQTNEHHLLWKVALCSSLSVRRTVDAFFILYVFCQ